MARLTPRQVVAYINGWRRSEHEKWRRAGLISITLRKLHGDKKANYDKLFPPWGHDKLSISDRYERNLRQAKAIAARREKAQRENELMKHD